MSPFTVVDVFAGIGGLSLGFKNAGFKCVAAVEHNPHHRKAFQVIHPGVNADQIDVATADVKRILRDSGMRRGELTVLIGGPPCQPFSLAGKRHGTQDVRGRLIEEYIRMIDELRPRAFVLENVPGLTSIHGGDYLNSLVATMSGLGYIIARPTVLNAADYGVPQFRRRLFVVGLRRSRFPYEFPIKTHGNLPELTLPLTPEQKPFTVIQPYITVMDAISDLPSNGKCADHSDISDTTLRAYSQRRPRNEYQTLMRGVCEHVTGNQVSVHQEHIIEAIRSLPPGGEEPNTRYRRLFNDRPSFTLRAGSGSFTALRPIHPDRPRVITVREAARLQSFPDNVEFSPIKKWAYQQIGNSVPPLLGESIARKLFEFL